MAGFARLRAESQGCKFSNLLICVAFLEGLERWAATVKAFGFKPMD
jgi:hypothetical protein